MPSPKLSLLPQTMRDGRLNHALSAISLALQRNQRSRVRKRKKRRKKEGNKPAVPSFPQGIAQIAQLCLRLYTIEGQVGRPKTDHIIHLS
jgi:hypothetical protein